MEIKVENFKYMGMRGIINHLCKISMLYYYFFFVEFIQANWLIKSHRFQARNSIIHHLYIVLCVRHPKSSLLPSPFTLTHSLLYPLTLLLQYILFNSWQSHIFVVWMGWPRHLSAISSCGITKYNHLLVIVILIQSFFLPLITVFFYIILILPFVN